MLNQASRALVRVSAAVALALLLPAMPALADAARNLQVLSPWLRATPPGSTVAAGYLTLRNTGNSDLKLVGVSSPLAQSCEIHQSIDQNNRAEMRPVTGGLVVKAGQTLSMAPGGYHLMLMGLNHPLVAGSSGTLALLLGDGSRLQVTAPVRAQEP